MKHLQGSTCLTRANKKPPDQVRGFCLRKPIVPVQNVKAAFA